MQIVIQNLSKFAIMLTYGTRQPNLTSRNELTLSWTNHGGYNISLII